MLREPTVGVNTVISSKVMSRFSAAAIGALSQGGNVIGAGKPRLKPKLRRHQARVGAYLRGPTSFCYVGLESLPRLLAHRYNLAPDLPHCFTAFTHFTVNHSGIKAPVNHDIA